MINLDEIKRRIKYAYAKEQSGFDWDRFSKSLPMSEFNRHWEIVSDLIVREAIRQALELAANEIEVEDKNGNVIAESALLYQKILNIINKVV